MEGNLRAKEVLGPELGLVMATSLGGEPVGPGEPAEEPLFWESRAAAAGEEVRSCPAASPGWKTPLRSHKIKVLPLQLCI